MANKTILAARESFTGRIGKDEYEFYEGDLIAADHPAAQKWPHAFTAPTLRYPASPPVEQATKAPGEKRKR